MRAYVEFLSKIKIENNQYCTPEECIKLNESHKTMGLNLEIKSDSTRKNPGMKQLAKYA